MLVALKSDLLQPDQPSRRSLNHPNTTHSQTSTPLSSSPPPHPLNSPNNSDNNNSFLQNLYNKLQIEIKESINTSSGPSKEPTEAYETKEEEEHLTGQTGPQKGRKVARPGKYERYVLGCTVPPVICSACSGIGIREVLRRIESVSYFTRYESEGYIYIYNNPKNHKNQHNTRII